MHETRSATSVSVISHDIVIKHPEVIVGCISIYIEREGLTI